MQISPLMEKIVRVRITLSLEFSLLKNDVITDTLAKKT